MYHSLNLQKQFLIKFLTIKAKYYVIEPHYLEGTIPDWPGTSSRVHLLIERVILLFFSYNLPVTSRIMKSVIIKFTLSLFVKYRI